VQSLAVDDEPEVFWDGADADDRVERWQEQVGWQASWGSVTSSNNGTSGRGVLRDVLAPLGIAASEAHFTDCYRRYLLQTGPGSQAAAIARAYESFAGARGLPPVSLPAYPATERAFVRMALSEDDGHVLAQLQASGADLVVTLGQPAADVLGELLGIERVLLTRDSTYGTRRDIWSEGRWLGWLPLKHPGQRRPEWVAHHGTWAAGLNR
jgi:hypothetical protein